MKATFILLLLGICSFSMAQRTITGQVKDADDETLPGVSIIIKGTSIGTTSDIDGNYSLTVSDEATDLIFNYIGYEAITVAINGQSVINVVMNNVTELQEVVVSALGFTSKRDRAGSTSSSISSNAIRTSGETGILNSLAGKAAGVKIARANGDPGAGTSIQIRGANTIGGSAQPLVIVDGVPLSNDNLYGSGSSRSGGVSQQSRLNDLNPEDIESVQVLKGASAAALWGSGPPMGYWSSRQNKASSIKRSIYLIHPVTL